MGKLKRSERRIIRDELNKLTAIDIGKETPKTLQQKIAALEALLDQHGAVDGSQFRTELDDFGSRANAFFARQARHAIDDRVGERTYAGISGRSKVRIDVKDHLYLQKRYSDRLCMGWGFDREGRIDRVTAFLEDKPTDLARLVEGQEFQYWNVPAEVSKVWEQGKPLSPLEQYSILFKTGHDVVKALGTNIRRNLVKDFSHYDKGMFRLTEIGKDKYAMAVISKAAQFLPELRESDKGFTVSYLSR